MHRTVPRRHRWPGRGDRTPAPAAHAQWFDGNGRTLAMHAEVGQRVSQLFARAAQQHRGGQLHEAARLYREILDLDPRHADALHLLGVVALQRGYHQDAVELIGRAITRKADVPAFHTNLGNALRARGQLAPAADAFQRALALNPQAHDTRYNLAVVLQEAGQLDEARGAYEAVLRARPEHAAARSNLGNLFNAQGRFEDALGCFEATLRAQPDFLPALVNRGNVLKGLGRLDEAAQSYLRALAVDPRNAPAHNNLGLALFTADRLDEAIAAYQGALKAEPAYAEAHCNLGHALRERGRAGEAAASYQRALSIDPKDGGARLGLAMASIPVFVDTPAQSAQATGDFLEALSALDAWDTQAPGTLGRAVGVTQPFYLAYRPADVTVPLSRYGQLVCRAAAVHGAVVPALRHPAATSAARLRMVVVSGHVHAQHPVWEVLLRGILEHLPRERLEIFLYHTGSRVDDETRWARARVDHFVQGPRATAAWEASMRADRPDIVFYPELGMDPVTGALAAQRLAPLQVAAWGHPVTTGLPTVDLYVSGELLEAPEAEAHYVEQLVLLPGTGACHRASQETAQRWDTTRASEAVRFALPHQPIKFDPADDELLTRIARAVGRCEFWIAAPGRLGWASDRLHARLADAFRRDGLDPDEYLRLTPWLPRAQFLGFLDAMDVYLDCPAFSGYTTAWLALQRGMPIVCLEGVFLRQRLAAGLLRQTGMADGIARTRDEYVACAVRCAEQSRDATRRAASRQLIRQAAVRANDNSAAIHALATVLSQAARAGPG